MALQLRTSCLQWLRQRSSGIITAIDHMTFLLEYVETATFWKCFGRQEVADVFMEIQRAIVKEHSAGNGDQTSLIKFLNLFSLLWRNLKSMNEFRTLCDLTFSEKFSIEEVEEIVDLWAQASDETVHKSFNPFLRFVWTFGCDSVSKRTRAFISGFAASRPVNSAFDARWYFHLLTQRQTNELLDIEFTICDIPAVLPTTMKSITYLVNCWCLLDEADNSVASNFISKNVLRFLDLLNELVMFGSNKHQLFEAGLGRLFRCITLAIVKRTNLSFAMKPLRDFLFHSFNFLLRGYLYFTKAGKMRNLFSMFSRKEMAILLDCFNDETRKPPSKKWHRFFDDNEMKSELEAAIEIEDGWPPLSQADADILFLPDHINDAITSLPHKATFLPEVGVFTLIWQNKERLPFMDWTQHVLALFNKQFELTPIPSIFKDLHNI